MNKIISKTASIIRRSFYKIFLLLPVRKDVVLFESNLGRNYTGNPRAVYEEMVRRGLDRKYKLVYVMEDFNFKLPGRGKTVARLRTAYYYYLAVAGTYVVDTRMPKGTKKRKECLYIQTWHGTPLKKLALDMKDVDMAGVSDIKTYHKEFTDDAKNWDILISQNAFSTKIFRRAFDFKKEILEIGYPRNDVLIRKNNPQEILKLKKKLGLPTDRRILLYAPTWRDDEYTDKGNYRFNPSLDFAYMKNSLEGEYALIVKYHYLIRDAVDWSSYKGFIYNFGAKEDISELYLVSDALITDYSSVMFDYCILRRPIYFYVYDLEKYRENLRGFYFDLEKEAPGALSKKTEELVLDILDGDASEGGIKNAYKEKYDSFCRKYCHRDDGKAAYRLTQRIIRGK